jgi:hypothetical protein
MEFLIKYLKCGRIEKEPKTSVLNFTVYKITDITNIIIPYFEQKTIHGTKRLDYLDFYKVTKLMTEGAYLTLEGLDLIRTIKAGMNTGRKLK